MVAQHHSAPTSLLLEGSAAVHLVKEETQTLTEQHSALVELRVASAQISSLESARLRVAAVVAVVLGGTLQAEPRFHKLQEHQALQE
jgi:hypothetical protein